MISSSNFAAGKVAGLGRAAMMMNFVTMCDEWIEMMKKNREAASGVQMGILAVAAIDPALAGASLYNQNGQKTSAIAQLGTMLVAMA
jgi:hypothetical protein